MRKLVLILVVTIIASSSLAYAGFDTFKIRPITKKEFSTFIKVFSEMRGPLRVQIMKKMKTNFQNADPLAYVNQVKDEPDVQKALKKNKITWDGFTEIMANILLGYFSIQPEQTKAGLIRQLSTYNLMMANDQIPAEYQPMIQEVIKTDEGAALAGMALEMFIQIPPENVAIAKKNKRTLDQLFYTHFWKDKVSGS